jgi:hypothetical protein
MIELQQTVGNQLALERVIQRRPAPPASLKRDTREVAILGVIGALDYLAFQESEGAVKLDSRHRWYVINPPRWQLFGPDDVRRSEVEGTAVDGA